MVVKLATSQLIQSAHLRRISSHFLEVLELLVFFVLFIVAIGVGRGDFDALQWVARLKFSLLGGFGEDYRRGGPSVVMIAF